MSVGAKCHSKSVFASQGGSSATLDSGPMNDRATYGLSRVWQDWFDAAVEAGVLWEFLFAIDVTLGKRFANAFGTLIAELTNRISFQCLCNWEEEGEEAVEILLRLARATLTHPAGFGTYNRLTQERSARAQFEGALLQRDYLLALIIQPAKYVPTEDLEWIQIIRIWMIVHSFKRGLENEPNIQDGFLRDVATGIRLACERDFLRLDVLTRLRTPIRDFDGLNVHIADQCTKLLKERRQEGLSATQIALIRAISSVAKLEQSRDDRYFPSPENTKFLSDSAIVGRLEKSRSADRGALIPAGCEDSDAPFARVFGTDDEEEGELYEALVDASDSYHHQRLKAGSVLLLINEEYHLLPWSWLHPNPFESEELSRQITRLLESPDAGQNLLGAFAWMAVATARSLRRLLDIEVASGLEAEWRLHPELMILQRIPPMRSRGWLPGKEGTSDWVRPVAVQSTIMLPPKVARVLHPIMEGIEDGTALGALWRYPEAPEVTWRTLLPPSLARVTAGMLGYVLPQRLYNVSGDATFALLLASHPASGLPGASAYASWGVDKVDAALNESETSFSGEVDGTAIGAGSRMDPIEQLLTGELRKAAEEVECRKHTGDCIAFHNAFVGYLYLMLLAGSGARPIRDLFESPTHLNLGDSFGYIDDKATDDAHQGRLVLLPRKLSQYLAGEYLRHLKNLASWLEPADAEFARRVWALAEGRGDSGIPFLFLLNPDAPAGWGSVSESAIVSLKFFGCPLPLRLFRHRLATRLRREGVDPEIVDSLLGHADSGGATHGDDSMRVWSEDMAHARPAVERVFEFLKMKMPTSWAEIPHIDPGKHPFGARNLAISDTLFGSAAREVERTQRAMIAREDAEAEIANFLAGRDLAELNDNEILTLSRRLLFNDKGLPRSTGGARYDVLMDKLEAFWQEQGKRLRVKKRYLRWRPPASVYRPEACKVSATYAGLRIDLINILADGPVSRLGASECAALAVVRLCVERRITSPAILRDVCRRENFRLVTMKGVPYFEHGLRLKQDDADAAVMRLRIDGRTARLLDRWLDSGRTMRIWDDPVVGILSSMQTRLEAASWLKNDAAKNGDLIEALCRIVDQENVMRLPGILAGHLAGRVESYALSWRDWVRLELGRSARFGTEGDRDGYPQPDSVAREQERLYGGAPISPEPSSDRERAQLSAHAFYAAIRAVLTQAMIDPAANSSRNERRRLASKLGAVIAEWNGKVSTTILLLGQWLPSYVFRPGKKNQFIAISSLERYFTALSPSFIEVASDVEILEMDEEEVTLFYTDLLSCRSVEDSKFVAERLGEFHRWASSQGVEDPDWSEMPVVMRGRRASPGFISEQEYHDALNILLADRHSSHQQSVGRAFLLLCCYRFGLREGEAAGMLREDFWRHLDEIVLFVRDNRLRKLKTKSSRRQVPMLFRLSSMELKIVDDWFMEVEARAGDREKEPIYGDAARARKRTKLATYIRPVILALKQVTGNPQMTLHHARHSAANRIALQVFGLQWPAMWRVVKHGNARVERHNLVSFLLGRPGASRRASWAMARFTGHAGSTTLYRSYIHLFGNWIDELVGPLDDEEFPSLINVVALDQFPPIAKIETPLLDDLVEQGGAQTLPVVLKFLRLLARRHSCAAAAMSLGLPLALADRICEAVDSIGEKMLLSKSVRQEAKKRDDDRSFLRRIDDRAWERIIRWADSLPSSTKSGNKIGDSKREIANDIPCTLDDVVRMISARRQLVLWREKDFESVRKLLDLAGVSSEQYEVWLSKMCGPTDLIPMLAEKFGFKPMYPAQTKLTPRLDTVRSSDNENLVQKRCCLLFGEARTGIVRNRYQLVAVFLAIAGVSVCVTEPNGKEH